MSAQIDLTVVLPAYLEEENLRLLLPRLKQTLEGTKFCTEIVIVDTTEPMDNTRLVCEEYSVRWVKRTPANSFGDAVRTGIRESNGTWTLFMDADGSHSPEFITQMLGWIPENDLVIASRYVAGGYTENSWLLTLMSRVLNVTYSVVLNIPCKDVSNSFKLYKTELLKGLDLKCQNFDIVEEILYKIFRDHPDVSVLEVPFTFKKRLFGDTKRNLVAFVITYIFTMVRLRLSSK